MLDDLNLHIKAKRTTGQWVKGYYVRTNYNWHPFGIHNDWIINSSISNGGYFNVIGRYPIDPKTICRYTGFEDVYEGDIVKWKSSDVAYYGVICYGEYLQMDGAATHNGFFIDWKYSDDGRSYICLRNDFLYWFTHEQVEVIGNKFDHPGLLGG